MTSRWKSASKRPRVGLVGFYGWGNFGDELFADSFQEHLGTSLDVRVLPELTISPYYRRSSRVAARSVDAIVIGGGDLVVPWKLSPLYWDRQYLARPVYIHGVGVPQLQGKEPSPSVLRALQAFFQHPNVRHVSARDGASARWIEQHLRPQVSVHCAPDVACALTLPVVNSRRATVGIVTRHRPGFDDDYSIIVEAARQLQDRGFRIRHIVLGRAGTRERDLAHAEDVVIPGKELVSTESLDDLCFAIGECSLLLSMKFHGTVIATMYGVPAISMMPTVKSVRFLTSIGRPELASHFRKHSLVELATSLPAPIDPVVPDRLQRESRAALHALREKIHADA